MVNNKIKSLLRTGLIALPITLILAFALKAIVNPLLFDRPEVAFAKRFVEANDTVTRLVGAVVNAELDERNTKVSIMPDRTEGHFDFRVEGERATENIRITWVYTKGPPPSFRADGLWILRSGKTANRIWP